MKLKSIVENFLNSPFHSKSQVFLVLASFSYTLIAINSGWGFFGVIRAPDFTWAFVFTFTVAIVLTLYVHALHISAAKKYAHWTKTNRLIWLLGFGMCLPLALELIVVELYFRLKGESILTNTFFDIDFVLVVIYIFLINAYYYYANYNQRDRLRIRRTYKNKIIPALKDLSALSALHKMEVIKRAPVSLNDVDFKVLGISKDQIACAYKIDNIITIHYFNQTTEVVKTSISKLLVSLKPEDYARINPYCFYHRLLIFSYDEINPSRRLYLKLRHPFNHLVHDHQRYVSQSESSYIKKWMKFNA